jgi:hypothetical protein
VEHLLSPEFRALASAPLAEAGLWAPWATGPAGSPGGPIRTEQALLQGAFDEGAIRISATDLVPSRVDAALRQGVLTYLLWGPDRLADVLGSIRAAWTP